MALIQSGTEYAKQNNNLLSYDWLLIKSSTSQKQNKKKTHIKYKPFGFYFYHQNK